MYRRDTRELPFPSLPRPLAEAIAAHAERHQLTLDRVRCWLTHSENPPADGFFGKMLGRRQNPVDPDAAHDTAVVLHPTHVIVATAGEKRGLSVLSLPLAVASFAHGSAIAARFPGAAAIDANDGFSLEGFPGEVGRPGTYFVGIGPGAPGADCARAIEAAIRSAKSG